MVCPEQVVLSMYSNTIGLPEITPGNFALSGSSVLSYISYWASE